MSTAFEITGAGVVLQLTEHCIETAMRHGYRDIVQQLLGHEEPSSRMQDAAALLEKSLAQLDFASLRATDPDLAGYGTCRVLVRLDEAGRVCVSKLDD